MAGTGCMAKVSGSKMEIAESTPMPGSTPTRLPISTPAKHHITLCSARATLKPCMRSARPVAFIARAPRGESCGATSEHLPDDRDLHLQHVVEQHDPERGDPGRERRRLTPACLAVPYRGHEHARESRGHQPGRSE